jgi:type II secretory pathway pseudopilin PulG
MRATDSSANHLTKRQHSAFTLVEVVMSIGIAAVIFGGIILAYTQSTRRAQWSGYSLAAESFAIQQIEQVRSSRWDPSDSSVTNEIFSLNLVPSSRVYTNGGYQGYTWGNLDLPTSGSNYVRATNYVTVRYKYDAGTGVQYFVVRVDTVWPFSWGSGPSSRLCTNTMCTIVAPDNRSPQSLGMY